jgi:hypothetical protein
MNRTFRKFLVPIALCCLPGLVAAGPGSAVTSARVLPLDIPKYIAAYDKFMASPVGKQFKGRLVLMSHLADGGDPATLSVLSLYHSQAEYETYSNAVMANEAIRAELLNAIVPIAQQTFTGRTALIKSWGDINDTDTIWENFYFTVTDYPAFIAALDAWLASPMGKKFPGQGHLIDITRAGAAPGTPGVAISVGYASLSESETYGDGFVDDPDWAKYLAAMAKVSTYLGSDLSRTLKTWGPATTKSLSAQ